MSSLFIGVFLTLILFYGIPGKAGDQAGSEKPHNNLAQSNRTRPQMDPFHCCLCEYGPGKDDPKQFSIACESWLRDSFNHNWCGQSEFSSEIGEKNIAISRPDDCKEVHSFRVGHSRMSHCINIRNSLEELSKRFANSTLIELEYSGCDTFCNVDFARNQLGIAAKNLRDGVRVMVTADQSKTPVMAQTVGLKGYCSGKYTFFLSKNGIDAELPGPCRSKSRCALESRGQNVYCMSRFTIKQQQCVCETPHPLDCYWIPKPLEHKMFTN